MISSSLVLSVFIRISLKLTVKEIINNILDFYVRICAGVTIYVWIHCVWNNIKYHVSNKYVYRTSFTILCYDDNASNSIANIFFFILFPLLIEIRFFFCLYISTYSHLLISNLCKRIRISSSASITITFN